MSTQYPLRAILVGLGKIARDQHLPTISDRDDITIDAIVEKEPGASFNGTPVFSTLTEALRAYPDTEAVILCTPPQVRFQLAVEALTAGCHVLLEKPPGASLSELIVLQQLAEQKQVTLFTGWHSRYAAGVEPARQWLTDKFITQVAISWKEDVRYWHPGQNWIFNSGGLGVFDPGINALSIVTYILPHPIFLKDATLYVPMNRQAPIAAALHAQNEYGAVINAEFDFLQQGEEVWNIKVSTPEGELELNSGGSQLNLNGKQQVITQTKEYTGLYSHFVESVRSNRQDTDLTPFRLVADAFMLGEYQQVKSFEW